MVDAQQVRTIVGVIGNVISFGLFLSPVPMFWRIIKKESVEEFQPYPYVFTVMNCMLWIFYGLPIVHKDSLLVTTINGVGLGIEAIYIGIFLYYCGDKKNFRRNIGLYLVAEIIGVVAVVLITLYAFKNYKTDFAKQTFVGVICDVFNIAMYASPCLVIKKVWTTKSVEYMPFWLSLISFLNAICWTAYSLLYKIDLYVLISNGLGTFLCAIQLAVYAKFYKSTPKGGSGKPSEIEISGTEKV
ncbi:hypothetical protein AALP_AA6G334100 [Arabis alpina]|uniref:Bidirectional sugar transporter SWEET n=1 Tax=Arabis alpina TaxID=50452 RepID=A0A087GTC4_ARAAL|nr:hypothetical protein AALP_AA6G334100 [Arabis alpina]